MTSVPFVHRNPNAAETQRLQLALSTFCDGSGMIMCDNGFTLPGWRDFERAVAAVFGGSAPEGKQVFDVFLPSGSAELVEYGLSLKSKAHTKKKMESLDQSGRVYMELANSPALFWNALAQAGIEQSDWGEPALEARIGDTLLATVHEWHRDAVTSRQADGKQLDLANSVYLTISYNRLKTARSGVYQCHAFRLELPHVVNWEYRLKEGAPRSLKGFDPVAPDQVLFDWYPFSGGQLKYYPLASSAIYRTEPFELLVPRPISLTERAARYWPHEWLDAGGRIEIAAADLAVELSSLAAIVADQRGQGIVQRAADELRNLD